MKITKKHVAEWFKVTLDNVKQVDSKQLFIVQLKTRKVLVSYLTIVGEWVDGLLIVTLYRYSKTTSKQLTQFISYVQRKGLPVEFCHYPIFS